MCRSVKTCSNDTLSKFSMLVGNIDEHTLKHTHTNALFEQFFCIFLGLPKMQVIRNYYGVPSPLCGPPLNIQVGDIIELIEATVRSTWWKVRQFYSLVINFSSHTALQERRLDVFSC